MSVTSEEIVTLVKDMFNEFGSSDVSGMEAIEQKYQPQMDELNKKTQDLAKELGDKYGVDLNSLLNTSDSSDSASTEPTTDETTEENATN